MSMPTKKKTDGTELCRLRILLKHPAVPMRQFKDSSASLRDGDTQPSCSVSLL